MQIVLGVAGWCVLSGCGAHYVVNSRTPLAKEDFGPDKKVGIAVFGNAAPGLFQTIADQVNKFAERDSTFVDVASGVTLNQEHTDVQSVQELSDCYPGMRYVLIVWQHPPEISRTYSTFNEGSHFSDPDYHNPVTAARDVTYYFTIFKLKCEILLFDLRQKKLIAKAVDSFSKTETRKDEHYFKNQTLLGTVEDLFDSTPNDSRYPDVRFLENTDFWGYFKRFLENIGKK